MAEYLWRKGYCTGHTQSKENETAAYKYIKTFDNLFLKIRS